MLSVATVVLLALAVFVVLATLLPLVHVPYWWVRSFDFPRVQIAMVAIVIVVLYAVVVVIVGETSTLDWVVLVALTAATIYQAVRIWPYTSLAGTQSPSSTVTVPDRTLRLVISNVLMSNREGERWREVVTAEDPDMVVTVETDAWWAATTGVLKATHPHAVQLPQDDTYGMCVYSRFPLEEVEVRHLVEEEVPSLFLKVRLPGGDVVQCIFLHPRPPRPDVQQDSTLRDAELVLAAREIESLEKPIIVAGDLNDVAWSYSTRLFQKLSGLLDPRIGRGLFASFHADHWWLRYPLDHVFHSDDLALVELKRLASVGSDHFPICIELAIDPSQRPPQGTPDADAADHEEADQIVSDADEMKAEESAEEHQERVEDDV